MLVIDDNMFKLAKMQETLLKVSALNREENLEKYKKTVLEIDTKAFADILEEIRHIDEHNQSLESELQFLERIKNAYDQLLELQSSFKRVCELYGNSELKLSDLSRLNIEYIEERINAIRGYLLNLRNIEVNKIRLQELSDKLIVEERKKASLDNKLLEMETILRNNFIGAEGRLVVNGELQYTSVVSEYKSLGFDFRELLNDSESLENKISELENRKAEVAESVKAAEICYNSLLSVESKRVLSEINRDFLQVKYELTLLKILKLLSQSKVNYDEFIKKREQLQDLIKYRLVCLDQLGIRISIDPFVRTKFSEQLETVSSITDNSKIIIEIKKEISELSSRTEEMLKQNNNYLISLSNTRNLIESNIGLSDIDITSVDLVLDEPLVKREVAQNQVVDVRNTSSTFNMSIVSQKTASVIKRVNQLMNGSLHKQEERKTVLEPDLVVIPSLYEETKPEEVPLSVIPKLSVPEVSAFSDDDLEPDEDEFEELDDDEELVSEEQELPSVGKEVTPVVNFNDIFETVTPFDEPVLFADKTDNSLLEVPMVPSVVSEVNPIDESEEINTADANMGLQIVDSDTVLPEAFWVTQDETEEEELSVGENVLSFDEQINKLISSESTIKSDSKVKRRAA